jgi:hypothetical protein
MTNSFVRIITFLGFKYRIYYVKILSHLDNPKSNKQGNIANTAPQGA